MTGKRRSFEGIPLERSGGAIDQGITEFTASEFRFARVDNGLMRITFGHADPAVDAGGTLDAKYTHAVTLSPNVALTFAQELIRVYGEPKT